MRPVASRLRPGCVSVASGCVPVASRLRPGCVLVAAPARGATNFYLRLFINKNCVIILKPVISFKSVLPRKITFYLKHPVFQTKKNIRRGEFVYVKAGPRSPPYSHMSVNMKEEEEEEKEEEKFRNIIGAALKLKG